MRKVIIGLIGILIGAWSSTTLAAVCNQVQLPANTPTPVSFYPADFSDALVSVIGSETVWCLPDAFGPVTVGGGLPLYPGQNPAYFSRAQLADGMECIAAGDVILRGCTGF